MTRTHVGQTQEGNKTYQTVYLMEHAHTLELLRKFRMLNEASTFGNQVRPRLFCYCAWLLGKCVVLPPYYVLEGTLGVAKRRYADVSIAVKCDVYDEGAQSRR